MVKKVLILAGGTGGHIFPALAVASEFRSLGHDILWIGSEHGMEAEIVPGHGIAFKSINIYGVRQMGLLRLLSTPLRVLTAIIQSLILIRRYKPDLTLGMGGFVSGPGGVASWLANVPLYIHEQNSVPGLTNKLLSRISKCVMTSFPGAFSDIKNKIMTGNPVRKEILKLDLLPDRIRAHQGPMRVLVLGGSRGAQALNHEVPKILGTAAKSFEIDVWHQCGRGNKDSTLRMYEKQFIDLKVDEFIDEIETAYEWADFAICRAGALTIAELCTVGLGAMFIPYPYAVDDHQTLNARYVADSGAAIVIQQANLGSDTSLKKIVDTLGDPETLIKMARCALTLASNKASENIAQICLRELSDEDVL